MRVPLEWLHEYCAPELDARALAERLATTGTEVERVEHHGVRGVDRFVVGHVLEAEQHPNADRLRVCRVDVGEAEPAQIVCGAPNVAAGQTVAVARPGAVMPDGTKLRAAKLRGLESQGMILAEDELAIGVEHDGIMVLDPAHPASDPAGSEAPPASGQDAPATPGQDAPATPGQDARLTPGAPLADLIPIATDVLGLEITPNRPDCLSVYGVAREVHAATGAPLSAPPWAIDPGSPGSVHGASVEIQCPELCPRFTARVFENVTVAPSPPWLKARLMAAGQRPISNVVDITNYVMILTGQPLHAFDLDRVAGARLTVRRAGEGEQVQTLDGQTRALDAEMVVIEDAEGPTSIAGVMGGARSEVGADTARVLLEAATWVGPNIHRTSLKLALRSEASGRFEKQLQPEQAMDAQAVATQLMIDLCGATVVPGTIDVGDPPPAPATIRLREMRVSGLLGVTVPSARCAEILGALEFGVTEAPDGLDVSVPSFRRADVTREADLIEEVARIDGVDKLPATLPSRHGASGRLSSRQRLRRCAADALTAQGLHEIAGWSFVAPELADRLRLPANNDRRQAVELRNPLSGDQSLLRTTLLGSLLDAAAYNRARGAGAVRLFDMGAVYLAAPGERLPREPSHIAALLSGPARPATWRDPDPRPADFFAAKGVLTALMGALRTDFAAEPAGEPFLHPGRSAAIVLGGERVGWLGEIHPLVAAAWDLEGDAPVAGFELDLDAVPAADPPGYVDVTSFPEVHEDLAVIVGDEVPAAAVLAAVRRAGGSLLAGAEVFDVYRDSERIGAGKVSLALRLAFRGRDRTLTDEEVAQRRAAIVGALEEQVEGRVRGG